MGRKKGYTRKPEIDGLIYRGLSQREIAQKTGYSRQFISIYLSKTNQQRGWLRLRQLKKLQQKIEKIESQEKEEMIQEEIQELVGLLSLECYRKLGYHEWPLWKTKEYFASLNHSFLDFQQVLDVFEAYRKAVQREEKISYSDLSQISGVTDLTLKKIFKRIGFRSIYRIKKQELRDIWEIIAAYEKAGARQRGEEYQEEWLGEERKSLEDEVLERNDYNDWTKLKVAEYLSSLKRRFLHYPLERYLDLIEDYRMAVLTRTFSSKHQLAIKNGLTYSSVSAVLKKAGLEKLSAQEWDLELIEEIKAFD